MDRAKRRPGPLVFSTMGGHTGSTGLGGEGREQSPGLRWLSGCRLTGQQLAGEDVLRGGHSVRAVQVLWVKEASIKGLTLGGAAVAAEGLSAQAGSLRLDGDALINQTV